MMRTAITTKREGRTVPGPSDAERSADEVEGAVRIWCCLASHGARSDLDMDGLSAAVELGDVFVRDSLEKVQFVVEELREPASVIQIRQELGRLFAVIPGAARMDREYLEGIHQGVCETAPSRGAVEIACRSLRRTMAFPPALSEVLKAIEHAEATITQGFRAVVSLPDILAKARRRYERGC